MQAFNRRGDPSCGFPGRAEHRGRLDHQKRPQPLSTGKDAMADRLHQTSGSRDLARQRVIGKQDVEHRIDIGRGSRKDGLEIGGAAVCHAACDDGKPAAGQEE